jgi:hypothetical protein
VLTRMGKPEHLTRALQCYDEGIAVLSGMPLDEHPTYRARLALAWMNRGLTAQAQTPEAPSPEAVRCFDQSIGQYPAGEKPAHSEQRRILCCAYLNRGHAMLTADPAQPLQAREDALAAMGLAAEFEKKELFVARMGMQARQLLCRAIAFLVDSKLAPQEWITDATDPVDDGMALGRHWRQLGENGLLELESQLFRFGALIYRLCQPHFLGEFLQESMDPDISPGAPVKEEVMHHIATDALWSVIMDIRLQLEADKSEENRERLTERLDEIQEVERRMTELRLGYVGEGGKEVVAE